MGNRWLQPCQCPHHLHRHENSLNCPSQGEGCLRFGSSYSSLRPGGTDPLGGPQKGVLLTNQLQSEWVPLSRAQGEGDCQLLLPSNLR